jgi:hypothetical protein
MGWHEPRPISTYVNGSLQGSFCVFFFPFFYFFGSSMVRSIFCLLSVFSVLNIFKYKPFKFWTFYKFELLNSEHFFVMIKFKIFPGLNLLKLNFFSNSKFSRNIILFRFEFAQLQNLLKFKFFSYYFLFRFEICSNLNFVQAFILLKFKFEKGCQARMLGFELGLTPTNHYVRLGMMY